MYVDLLGAVIRKGILKADKTLLCFFFIKMGWETGVRFPECAEIFVFFHAFETVVEPTQYSMQWVQRAIPSTENWLILKADDTTDEDCLGLYLCFLILNCAVNNLGGCLLCVLSHIPI